MQQQQDYSDSADFTDELEKVQDMLAKVSSIVTSEKWKRWMHATDTNFDTTAYKLSDRLAREMSLALDTGSDLADMLHNAG